MKQMYLKFSVAVALLICAQNSAKAQWTGTNPLYTFSNVGIGTSTPVSPLHVMDGSVLFSGSTGGTPTSGAGTRLMWVPEKKAFRIGEVTGFASNFWDNANIGSWSFAGGYNSKAECYGCVAYGLTARALNKSGTQPENNEANISLGYSTIAEGHVSVALGDGAHASGGGGATAIGGHSTAAGSASIAIGTSATANGSQSVAVGPGSRTDPGGSESSSFGRYGTASSHGSMVLSTDDAQATGDYSIAMGSRAYSGGFSGSFVYGDYDPMNSGVPIQNTADRQFTARARGGFVFNTDDNLDDNKSVVFDNGNMGIGLGSGLATEKLDINGKLRIRNVPQDNTAADVLVKDANGVVNYRDLSSLVGNAWEKTSGGIPTSLNDDIYKNGNVGIGTNSLAGRLHVVNPPCTGTPGIRVSATPTAMFCNPSFPQGNLFQADGYSSPGGGMVVPKFVITSDGAVGVNTTTPKMKMDINDGDMLFNGQNNLSYRFHFQFWDPAGSFFLSPADGNGNMTSGGLAVGSNGNVAIATGPSTVATERFLINGNTVPAANCSFSLGTITKRWNQIFLCNAPIVASDARLKTNVKDVTYGIEEIKKLRPVTYDLKDNPGQTRNIGFIAQEAKEVIREIVHVGDDADQTLGVKYSELIPVLVKAIQEQQQQIDDLKSQLAGSKSNDSKLPSSVDDPRLDGVKLYQNVPNPFTNTTEIGYYLPENIGQAAIMLYDLNGRQLNKYDLHQRGEGKIVIQGGELKPGIYLYSLLIEGREADTKRMVYTNN